ncbi:hypothetical protein SELMODRAFT_417267 [Selaginella moellendorffii]|uniref:N-acetyltransferase domain-containing protein n=1 Tax=Selaginella moellendorffii TaxID=88036 RepID=D8S2N7_SELML|nr:hypothetical protein SELMODRAFT_417267 [Selaginella moellendorffii]
MLVGSYQDCVLYSKSESGPPGQQTQIGDVWVPMRLGHDGNHGNPRGSAHRLGLEPGQDEIALILWQRRDRLHELWRSGKAVAAASSGFKRIEIDVLTAAASFHHSPYNLRNCPYPGLVLAQPLLDNASPSRCQFPRVLSLVPPWTRVYRIQRDIPMPLVTSGVEKGNLRELALMRMEDLGLKCRDVRTREAGIQDIHNQIKPEEVELVRRDYCANKGWETFLAYEDTRQDILVGLLRMRKCGPNATCPDLLDRCSIVRELHVYGTVVPVHGRDADKLQHHVYLFSSLSYCLKLLPICTGYGTLLMEEAERIARKEHRSVKLAVISGVGTRHYYRKLGYELEGPYMTKRL